jgi:hypothetical protein
MEASMAGQELEVQQKKEVATQQEKTILARFYVPRLIFSKPPTR